MKRVLLDTNIYGLMVIDKDRDRLRDSIEQVKTVVIYGLPLIRKELRDTPKNIKVREVNLRNYLLRLYEEVTKGRTLNITLKEESLADAYFTVYREIGGIASKQELIKDFIIVACASINSLDIVVSQDHKTMVSEKALKSYAIVNKIKKINLPGFLNYEEFKKAIR